MGVSALTRTQTPTSTPPQPQPLMATTTCQPSKKLAMTMVMMPWKRSIKRARAREAKGEIGGLIELIGFLVQNFRFLQLTCTCTFHAHGRSAKKAFRREHDMSTLRCTFCWLGLCVCVCSVQYDFYCRKKKV